MLNLADLPNDIAALKALLLAQDEVVEGLRDQLNTRVVEIEHLKLDTKAALEAARKAMLESSK